MAEAAGDSVVCDCGEVLLAQKTDRGVVLDDEEIQFRRRTDFVACPACGSIYSIRDVKPGAKMRQEDLDPLQELSALQRDHVVSEALEGWTQDLDLDDEDIDDIDDLTLDDFRLK